MGPTSEINWRVQNDEEHKSQQRVGEPVIPITKSNDVWPCTAHTRRIIFSVLLIYIFGPA